VGNQEGMCPYCGAGVNRHAVKAGLDGKRKVKCDFCSKVIYEEQIEEVNYGNKK
jgi:hypothetical protein